jgi:hypothetical protein
VERAGGDCDMTREQAETVVREIQEICQRHKVWWDASRAYKPGLKDIILTISVRITENDRQK